MSLAADMSMDLLVANGRTEGFADAFADDLEGQMEHAGVSVAGIAAMDNVARNREKRQATVKLAAISAFKQAGENGPPPQVSYPPAKKAEQKDTGRKKVEP